MHYNNPAGAAQAKPDASGFKLTITPNLRPYDVGVFTLGQTNLVLPPGQPHVEAPVTVSFCRFLPVSGVFYQFLCRFVLDSAGICLFCCPPASRTWSRCLFSVSVKFSSVSVCFVGFCVGFFCCASQSSHSHPHPPQPPPPPLPCRGACFLCLTLSLLSHCFSLVPQVCPAECTARLPIPVTLLGTGLHMHEVGGGSTNPALIATLDCRRDFDTSSVIYNLRYIIWPGLT